MDAKRKRPPPQPKRPKRPKKIVKDEATDADAAAAAANALEERKLAAAEAKEKKKTAAIEYMSGWARRDQAPWRFNKTLQGWWCANWGSTVEVAKGDFATFLEYAPTIAGAARTRLLEHAREAAAEEVEAADEEDAATKQRRKQGIRARKLVRALEAPDAPAVDTPGGLN
mmetsp:Transcript_23238/g.71797  ORF Transcript_23238/g.71797 Transcript_23238/m.71797 type:complete len:170 (+) Transcript_23238:331-840(+)